MFIVLSMVAVPSLGIGIAFLINYFVGKKALKQEMEAELKHMQTKERFIALIRTEQKSLRRFLLALCCGNRDEADDIAQDALVKAYLAIDKHEEQGKDTAWLYRIAYNTFLDTSRSRRTLHPIETLNEQPDSSFAADRDFRYQPLYMALEQLPPKERSAILLYYIKGYSVHEIADIVAATEDAIKQQLSRGRNKLKTLLKDE